MERRQPTRKIAVILALLWLAQAAIPCLANVAVLEIDRLGTPVARAEGVEITLDWPDGAARGQLNLRATLVDAGELGYRWRALDGRCALDRGADGAWRCIGRVKARGASGLDLSLRLHEGALRLELGSGRSRLAASTSDREGVFGLELVKVPAVWLQPVLATLWRDARLTAGSIDAQWQLQSSEDAATLGGPLALTGVGMDTADGRIAAEGIRAKGKAQLRLEDAATRIETSLDLSGGEFLVGALYVALPDHAIGFSTRLSGRDDGRWQVESLRWRDPDALDLEANAMLDFSTASYLRAAELRFALPDLSLAQPRYFDSLAASLGLAGLAMSGSAQGRLALREGDWHALDLDAQGVNLEDGQARFGATGVDGSLRLRHGSDAAEGTLSWATAHLHTLALGAARLPLRSVDGGVALTAPVSMSLLGGTLRLAKLSYAPRGEDERLELSLALADADLGTLSAAFGWPAFSGKVSGELPEVRYENQRLEFAGGLSAGLFDGQVRVSQLSMERPFGVAPMLAASIDFSGLDLAPLTGVFGFGEITGRLDGRIHGLRLVDWEPVAFDAAFHTVPRRGERQRISQRAVRELTEVGGGGLAAGLQNQVLKAFSSFGYSRIGLSCVLANNVCAMGGAGPADGGGYVIVDGSGLPRVNVIGHQKQVDWPVLVGRLKAATEGRMPVID